MRRIDSSFSLATLAVIVTVFAACGKGGEKSAPDAGTADTSNAVTTKTADTKAAGAPTTQKQSAAPAAKTAPVPAAVAPARPAAPNAAPVPVAGGKVDPGMTKAQVVALFGKPASDRTRGEFTYLLFANGMEQQVGMSDLVVLQGDKVVDAVLRAPNRSYSGTSTSPRAISAEEAAKKNAGSSNGSGPQP